MNKFYSILLIAVAALTLSGCFQDKSTFDVNKIDEVKIEVLSINYFDENSKAVVIPTLDVLNIKIKVTKGNNTSPKVSYSWKINAAPWLLPSIDLGDKN